MASWGEQHENPFTPISAQAAKVFGAWLRELVNEREPGKTKVVLGRMAFILEMDKRLKLVPSDVKIEDPITPELIAKRATHYRLRPSIDEVVFMQRDPARARFLLPEADAIGRFEDDADHVVDLPTCYIGPIAKMQDGLTEQEITQLKSEASYPYKVKADGYKDFLDPFMAAYTCSQCA